MTATTDADHLDRVLGAINRALAEWNHADTPGFADAPIVLSYDELWATRRWIVNEPPTSEQPSFPSTEIPE